MSDQAVPMPFGSDSDNSFIINNLHGQSSLLPGSEISLFNEIPLFNHEISLTMDECVPPFQRTSCSPIRSVCFSIWLRTDRSTRFSPWWWSADRVPVGGPGAHLVDASRGYLRDLSPSRRVPQSGSLPSSGRQCRSFYRQARPVVDRNPRPLPPLPVGSPQGRVDRPVRRGPGGSRSRRIDGLDRRPGLGASGTDRGVVWAAAPAPPEGSGRPGGLHPGADRAGQPRTGCG